MDEEGLVWFCFRACISGTAFLYSMTCGGDKVGSVKAGGGCFNAKSVGTTAPSTVISLLDTEQSNDCEDEGHSPGHRLESGVSRLCGVEREAEAGNDWLH
jgi:hypothetical protein